jgi:hypothetical protein
MALVTTHNIAEELIISVWWIEARLIKPFLITRLGPRDLVNLYANQGFKIIYWPKPAGWIVIGIITGWSGATMEFASDK